jgi:hypothetical protein
MMASVIMSRITRQESILFKIHSYRYLHDIYATGNIYARSECDVVVEGEELANLGSWHGQKYPTCPWKRRLWVPLYNFWELK